MLEPLPQIHRDIAACAACTRLRGHCLSIAQTKRRAYLEEDYWGKPITGFGDPNARLGIIGLAPAAHGANRTGRIFTGDRSGDWLYSALYRAGFANQPTSVSRRDGLKLRNCYVTCVVKCAPPQNKPLPAELKRCSRFLRREIESMPRIRVWIALGQIALAGIWPMLAPGLPRPKFGHANEIALPDGKWLILSYHPSQQNTFTGRLTQPMFDQIFKLARLKLGKT